MGALCRGRWISGIPAIVVTMIQNIFRAQAGAGIRLNFLEIVRWESVPRGSFPRTYCPWVSEDGSVVDSLAYCLG